MFRPKWFVLAAAITVPLIVVPSAFAADPPVPTPNPLKPTILCNNLQGGTCLGTPRGDTLIGGNNVDHIFGLGGDDDIEQNLVFLSGASDDAHGGPGRDCIDGGGGVSQQFGDDGDDNVPCEFTAFVDPQAALTSGPGNDIVHGGKGNDSMDGIFDSDKLYGDEGDDLINDPYPLDHDELYGGPGSDILNAADGDPNDIIDGDGADPDEYADGGGFGPGQGPAQGPTKGPAKGHADHGGKGPDKGNHGGQPQHKDFDTCYGDAGDTFRNCEKIVISAVPLLISPSGPVPLPRALLDYDAAHPGVQPTVK